MMLARLRAVKPNGDEFRACVPYENREATLVLLVGAAEVSNVVKVFVTKEDGDDRDPLVINVKSDGKASFFEGIEYGDAYRIVSELRRWAL